MRVFAVEDKPGGQRTAQLAQAGERLLASRVAAYVEGTLASDPDLDIVAFLQLKRFDDRDGQTNREAVSPF